MRTTNWACAGQASVEYALVVCACLAVVVSMAALWHMFADGAAVHVVVSSLGHSLPYGLFDVLQY